MDEVKITVLMCVYNGQRYLREAIDSILNQTYSDFEFLIVDDGSTDDTLKILKSYKDSRIKLVLNDNNIGLTKSLNKGLMLAKGEYIARMDADDISVKNRLLTQLNFMQQNNYDLIYSDTFFIDKNGEYVCKSFRPASVDVVLRNLKKHNFIPHPTVFFKKETILNLGGYDERFKTAQDLQLWLKMYDSKMNFGYINEPLVKYRLNPESIRKGIYSNYYFTLANYCIWNGSRWAALKYISKVDLKYKLIITLKLLFPMSFYHRKIT